MAQDGIYNPIAIVKEVITGNRMEYIFGRNIDVDAAEDIWAGGGDYTGWASLAELVQIFSSSASDAAAGTGARTVFIEGLDSSYNLQSETMTLNGVTPVVSVNSYLRVFRTTVLTAGNVTQNVGTLTIRQNTTIANVMSIVPIGFAISQGTQYTIPLGKTGFIINYGTGVNDAVGTRVEMAFKIRPFGGATQYVRPYAVSGGNPIVVPIFGGIKLEAKTDVIVRALSTSAANAPVNSNYDLLLVDD